MSVALKHLIKHSVKMVATSPETIGQIAEAINVNPQFFAPAAVRAKSKQVLFTDWCAKI